jgi:uncharacterized protein YndB with AHSA1/START domain
MEINWICKQNNISLGAPKRTEEDMGTGAYRCISLRKEFNYNVPIEEVWQALTDKDTMKKWYFPQLQKFEPIVGFKFQFDDNSAEYRKEWIVTQVAEGKTLSHSWAY